MSKQNFACTSAGTTVSDPGPTLTEAEELCAQKLLKLDLQAGGEVAPYEKESIGRGINATGDQAVKLSTNVFPLKLKPITVHQYRMEWFKQFTRRFRKGQIFPFVQTGTRRVGDCSLYENRQMFKKLFDAFVARFPGMFGEQANRLCYDLDATLYAIKDLDLSHGDLQLLETEVNALISRPYNVILKVKQLADISVDELDAEKFSPGSDLVKFLEAATAHYALNHPEDHLMFDSSKTSYMDFQKFGVDSPDIGKGKYLAAGASKTGTFVEGPSNQGVAALVVDSKSTLFYHSIPLMEMCSMLFNGTPQVLDRLQWDALENCVKDLECYRLYGTRQNQIVQLRGLSRENALASMITVAEEDISIAEYFQQKYGITLQYPYWPLAIAAFKVAGGVVLYPLELLHVADNQRVRGRNITPSDVASIIKLCSVAPYKKQGDIQKAVTSYSCNDDPFLHATGTVLLEDPVRVDGRIFQPPQIQYANGTAKPEGSGKWQLPNHAEVVVAGNVSSWAAVLLKTPGDRLALNDFVAFVEDFHEACSRRGTEMPQVADVKEVAATPDEIAKLFERADEAGIEFLLFGHSDKDVQNHALIKALERQHSIITQCVKTLTIGKILMKASPLSLENIISKTNVKLGGLNYNVTLNDVSFEQNILFIGLAMNHPAGGYGSQANDERGGSNPGASKTNVSILGFSANDGCNPNEMIGNFFLQPMGHNEAITVLYEVLDEVFERFKRNRKCSPSHVIIYRSGCSETMYPRVVKYEIPVIAALVKRHARDAPFTVIVPSREHSFKLFKQNIKESSRAVDQNVQPGTIVDRAITSQKYAEFFLNGHLAIKGTSRTPKYTVIYNSGRGITFDMLQRWTYGLCYNFQIVNSPVSLPAPVYIAGRYAERGRQIFNSLPKPQNAAGGAGRSRVAQINGQSNDPYYLQSLDYNYTDNEFLRGRRVNA